MVCAALIGVLAIAAAIAALPPGQALAQDGVQTPPPQPENTPPPEDPVDTNRAPAFDSDRIEVSVREGERELPHVRAIDPNNESLTYALSGPDAEFFRFNDANVRIVVAPNHELDYETRTSYQLRLRATDNGGLYAEAEIAVLVIDVDEPPGQVERPNVDILSESSARASWTEPPGTGGPPVTSYDLELHDLGSGNRSLRSSLTGLSLVLNDLTPGAGYSLRVRALNDEGAGPWSESITFSMPEAAEPPPEPEPEPEPPVEEELEEEEMEMEAEPMPEPIAFPAAGSGGQAGGSWLWALAALFALIPGALAYRAFGRRG